MKLSFDQSSYWDKVAYQKTFRHQPDWPFIQKILPQSASILDLGCGYGRLTYAFFQKGYIRITGLDSSSQMIQRAASTYPELPFVHHLQEKLPFPAHSFDCVLLFTVLTCIPHSQDQAQLMQEITRILKPSGRLYISDLLIGQDKRNQARYAASTHPEYGVFSLEEGATFRHHQVSYLVDKILKDFALDYRRTFPVITMNGHTAQGIQLSGIQQPEKQN